MNKPPVHRSLAEDSNIRQERLNLLKLLRNILTSHDPVRMLDQVIDDLSASPSGKFEGEFRSNNYNKWLDSRWMKWVNHKPENY
jgi:hypothetical protein